jgi:hypothetical protein
MPVFSYRTEHSLGELNYWKDLMTRWGVGWIAGSEHKAHGKMASLFVQPYISPPDYDTAEIPSKKDIQLAQQKAVNEYERTQQSNATAPQEVPPQYVNADGMRTMKLHRGFPSVQSSCSYVSAWRHTAAQQNTERTKRR